MGDLLLCVDTENWDTLTDQDGLRVAATYGDDRQTRWLLAMRIVLCWNACRGLTNEQIRHGLTPNADLCGERGESERAPG